MAATVGATFPAGRVFPARHTNMGPFKSSAGNYYSVFIGTSANTSQGNTYVEKASDPMSSFANAGGAKTISSANNTQIEAMACYQVSDVIHIVTQIATGACYYNSFNMGTDAWNLATSEVAIAAASQAPVTGTTFCDIVVRSGGEVVIVFNAGQTSMSSTFNMVRCRRRTGTNTWVYHDGTGTATNIDNGGSVNWFAGPAARGASDRVHIFFQNITSAGDLHQRTLRAANTLETFPATYKADWDSNFTSGRALSYDDGGTTKVRHVDATGIAKLDSADTPTVSWEGFSDSGAALAVNGQKVNTIAVDSTTIHALWSHGADGDLMHDSSASGGGAFGTDVEELAGTINHITANVYTRSGTQLAMVLDDGGTIKYAEITLAGAPAADTSLLYPTETPYRILSRR